MKVFNALLLAAFVAAAGACSLPVKESSKQPTEDGKQPVCHKGKTIYVNEAAVAAHIKHGDYGRTCYGERKGGAEGTQ